MHDLSANYCLVNQRQQNDDARPALESPLWLHNSVVRSEFTIMAHAVRYQADLDPPYCSLNVKSAFDQLSAKEKRYAHHINVASWAGARIIQGQWTPHAQELYTLLILIFTNPEDGKCVDFNRLKEDSKVSDENWKHATSYTAQVLGNLVNYKSFGFSKFIPRIRPDDFKAIVEASPNKEQALLLWDKVSGHPPPLSLPHSGDV